MIRMEKGKTMDYYIGIDLGTSSVKVLLLGEQGKIKKTAVREYPCYFPHTGWSEQNPADWYEQTIEALKELLCDGKVRQSVRSISFSGQMHGLVLLDDADEVIRPAILWNDTRSGKETERLNQEKAFLMEETGNQAFAGFTLPKLLWVRDNEPENGKRIAKVMLPKDYLAYRLTGRFCTDVSDASGTLYFDVKNRCWSEAVLHRYGIPKEWLPQVLESDECAGSLKSDIGEMLGIRDVSVVIGAGDNAAAAIGTGTVQNGDGTISLGTSGTVFVVSDTFFQDRDGSIHSFCSATHSYHQLACILSAAACSRWWVEKILRDDFDSVCVKKGRMGENEVFFLPYLMGERSPLNDTRIRGMFYGMGLSSDKDDMTLAVLEGVAFALRQNIDRIREMGIPMKKVRVCGGGAANRLWLEVLSNVLHANLLLTKNTEGASLGAAMLAAKAVLSPEAYSGLEQKVYAVTQTICPDEAIAANYEEKYSHWLKLYPALKEIC